MRRYLLAAICFAMLGSPSFADPSSIAPTTNGSVVIATGNTFQTVLAAVAINNNSLTMGRRSLTIQNNNAADSCWIFVGSAAAEGNINPIARWRVLHSLLPI